MTEPTQRRYVSGFCSAGHHEGGRYPGPSGKLNKTCSMIGQCQCDDPSCHKFWDRMFESTGQDRQVVDNSGYVPEKHTWVMPEPVVVETPSPISSVGVVIPDGALESPAPGVVAPAVHRSFAPTSSGRAARGQLEAWVKRSCDVWIIEQLKHPCTPQWISLDIAKTEGIKPPSTGAISAVFDKWQEIGFAITAKKPTRFCNYTEDGLKYGLDAMKERVKRAEKRGEEASRRGVRA